MRLRTIHFVVAVSLVATTLAAADQVPQMHRTGEVITEDTTVCSAEVERLRKLVDEQKKMIDLLNQKIGLLEEEKKARAKEVKK